MLVERISKDDYFMRVAELTAQRSLCWRSQVGTTLVTASGRIASVGYNGPPSGLKTEGLDCSAWCPRGMGLSHKPGYVDCNSGHSESNALVYAERGELLGGTAYVTRAPCAPCAKALAASGIIRIVYGPDEGGVYHKPEEVVELLALCDVEMIQYG